MTAASGIKVSRHVRSPQESYHVCIVNFCVLARSPQDFTPEVVAVGYAEEDTLEKWLKGLK
jgi:hypothetical protein